MKTSFWMHMMMVVVAGWLCVQVPTDVYAQSRKKANTTQKASSRKSGSSTQKTRTTTSRNKKKTSQKPLSRAHYEKQQKDLQKQIRATEKMISDNDKSVRSQRRDIKLREDEIGKRRALIVAMQHEIEAIRYEEDSLQRTIQELKKSFESKQTKYVKAVRHMYKWRSGYEEIQFILSADDMMEGMRRMRYLRQYSMWRKSEAEALKAERIKTEQAQEALAQVKTDRQNKLKEIESERSQLQAKQSEQQKKLASLQKRKKELQRDLARDKKEQAAIQKKIQQLIAEERRKAEEALRKAEEAERKRSEKAGKTNKGKTTAETPSYAVAETKRLTGTFRQNRGKMPYPVDTNFAFLRHYNQKKDGNVGISLSTGVGANACAVFEGIVTRCSLSSEDWTVIVSHGDYMSVYSNLASVAVKEGERIKMRQVIGKVKTDIDGHHGELMFWIYGKNDAENPELWLKK